MKEKDDIKCTVLNRLPNAESKKVTLIHRATDPISLLYETIKLQFNPSDFELYLLTSILADSEKFRLDDLDKSTHLNKLGEHCKITKTSSNDTNNNNSNNNKCYIISIEPMPVAVNLKVVKPVSSVRQSSTRVQPIVQLSAPISPVNSVDGGSIRNVDDTNKEKEIMSPPQATPPAPPPPPPPPQPATSTSPSSSLSTSSATTSLTPSTPSTSPSKTVTKTKTTKVSKPTVTSRKKTCTGDGNTTKSVEIEKPSKEILESTTNGSLEESSALSLTTPTTTLSTPITTAAVAAADAAAAATEATTEDVTSTTSTSPKLKLNHFLLEDYLETASSTKNNITPPPALMPAPLADRHNSIDSNKLVQIYSTPRVNHGYVGLVNQAMTCYLNSLLQALYMTPEFRNAMYTWEYEGENDAKSITYQLQRLFLNLQTSTKSAVETTDLTKSFGWHSTDAWQQHDVQELCRVMFDALEGEFKNTKQADLINCLYQGKMMDYVKCLECMTEKSREDTFLDIPLPVRPFGKSEAYESIEEALRAFVEPEKLDGNNQYFCEKCNRKCDAHKGLKFTKFPYILTLHLKRFDFDYQTFHRIKLNDKVTFPQTLNLNSFINESEGLNGFMQQPQQQQQQQHQQQQTTTVNSTKTTHLNGGSGSSEHGSVESAIKCDDCSTTDSESAIEEESFNNNNNNNNNSNGNNINNGNGNNQNDEDEGIDMSTSTDNKSTVSSITDSGPYIYELFAIMIHSGSASGGHYYAYIKEFKTGEWYCFNDQSVSMATQEDINKSFGGATTKSFYCGAYSSSTNAYMLMFRQLDPQRNAATIKSDEFPEHILKLQQLIKEKQQTVERNRELEFQILNIKVYFWNKKQQQMLDFTAFMSNDETITDTLKKSYDKFHVSQFGSIERCRLVAYNNNDQKIIRSFEGEENRPLEKSLANFKPLELLLEIRDENQEFEQIKIDSVLTKVFTVNIETGDIDGPFNIWTQYENTVAQYKTLLIKKLSIKIDNLDNILLAQLKFSCNVTILDFDTNTLKLEGVHDKSKMFVAVVSNNDAINQSKLSKIVERADQLITLNFVLPDTDKENLEKMGIPSYEESVPSSETPSPSSVTPVKLDLCDISPSHDVVDATMTAAPSHHLNDGIYFVPTTTMPIPTAGGGIETEIHSEDSSLSDRTLVDAGQEVAADLSSTNNSPAMSDTQLSSPEYHSRRIHDFDCDDEDSDMLSPNNKSKLYYFRATYSNDESLTHGTMALPSSSSPTSSSSTTTTSTNNSMASSMVSSTNDETIATKPQRMLRVLVDSGMTIGNLKRSLEPFVKVPKEFFKIFQMVSSKETECTRMGDQLSKFKDGERLYIELGRALRKGEYKCKVYYFKISDMTDELEKLPCVCEWIFRNGANVGQTKRDIIAHLQSVADPKYGNLSYDMCRLRNKSYRSILEIYTDDQKFGDDITLIESSEIVLQEIDDASQPYTDSNDRSIFVRRWNPSKMTLDRFEEITLSMSSKSEFKEVVSNLSKIPIDRLEHSKIYGVFPYNNLSVLKIQSLTWSSEVLTSEDLQHRIGETYFYRDKDEPLKKLTPEERRELNNKENNVGSSSYAMHSSSRRERALIIHRDPK